MQIPSLITQPGPGHITIPPGVTRLHIELIGGGGGGGRGKRCGGGGGGSAATLKTNLPVEEGEQILFHVGKGGEPGQYGIASTLFYRGINLITEGGAEGKPGEIKQGGSGGDGGKPRIEYN